MNQENLRKAELLIDAAELVASDVHTTCCRSINTACYNSFDYYALREFFNLLYYEDSDGKKTNSCLFWLDDGTYNTKEARILALLFAAEFLKNLEL